MGRPPWRHAYRVYRSVAPDNIANVGFLATVSVGTSFIDYGDAALSGVTPLPAGSVGVWHAVASLNAARGGHQSLAVRSATANQLYLYVLGGNNGATFLDTVEYNTVTITAPTNAKDTETQTLAASWTTDSTKMPAAVSDFRAYALVECVATPSISAFRITYTRFSSLDLDFESVNANDTVITISTGRASPTTYSATPYTAVANTSGGGLLSWVPLLASNNNPLSVNGQPYGFSCVATASQFTFLVGGANTPTQGISWNLGTSGAAFKRNQVTPGNPNNLGSQPNLPGGSSVMADCVFTRGNLFIAGGNANGYGGGAPTKQVSYAGL